MFKKQNLKFSLLNKNLNRTPDSLNLIIVSIIDKYLNE